MSSTEAQKYRDTLDFLYSKLPMYSRIGQSAYKKDLTNTLKLCEILGNPHQKFKSIHIGGTNGKGSTTNYIASMYIEAGLKVGIYTSPHLYDFRERIKIGHQMIPKSNVISFVDKMKSYITEIEPSFFELTVAMAMEYFASESVDVAIIEVGLGGRLDSTNIIQPILSLVTNISLDHTSMLGNTLEKIAYEKAGIIKSNTPFILGEDDSVTESIFREISHQKNAPYSIASHEVAFISSQNIFSFHNHTISVQSELLTPSYQIKNIQSAIWAFYQSYTHLLDISDERMEYIIRKGLEHRTANTGFLGRWTEVVYQGRKIIFEAAHNEAGILEMLNELERKAKNKTVWMIYGCVNDKDVNTIVAYLPPSYHYVLSQADIPRAMDIDSLNDIFRTNSIIPRHREAHLQDAIYWVVENSQAEDIIIITGSIFLVGEAMTYICNIIDL